MIASEITLFAKSGGPLTKRISLAVDGSLRSDGSACVMACGEARRARIAGVEELAALIERLHSNEALALGVLRPGLTDPVKVITKAKLNGAAPNVIARTGQDVVYRKGQSALALLDFDSKGMPAEVAAELRRHGGFWSALVAVLPELAGVAHLTRRSTSAGLFRSDTATQLPGSDGLHVYVEVQDGTDIERFLKTLHVRCFLAGFGWLMVGAAGQLLERSVVDRMVGAPERLVFEGAPILDPPLRQDKDSRRPVAVEGDVLDTLAACPPLSVVEESKLRELRAKWAHCLAGEAGEVRREASVAVRIEGEERRVEIVWQFAGRGWRLYVICEQCQKWRHHLYWRQSKLACFRCHHLTHRCRTVGNQLPLKAARLRKKLGAQSGLLSRLPPRPRHNTAAARYDRLASELARVEAQLAGQLRATLRAVEKRRRREDERSASRRTR